MPIRILALALVGILPLAPPAAAHHGWSTYDPDTVLALEAPILAARYVNPHGELEVEADGRRWLVILAPPSRLQRRGVAPEDLAVGSVVTVEGYPSRVNEAEMRAERITIDGRTIELR